MRKFIHKTEIELLRLIAAGGMAEVYEADKHGCEGFSKRVAVKMMHKRWTRDPRFLQMFRDEANLVSDLVHENIVQTLQFGKTDEGAYFIVMEYVDGVPLSHFIACANRDAVAVPEALAVHLVSRIARGLAYAHHFRDDAGRSLDIVHRDVCPRNILVTREGLAKLSDFGIAKAVHMSAVGDDWQTGKLAYMSPEQAGREPLDCRTDVFSLGAVLFELLCGETIRSSGSDPQLESFTFKPIPWALLPESVGPDLRAILKRMLSAFPEDRYECSNQLARDLEHYIYKDGYGPTIQTVENYMREHFSELYIYPRPSVLAEASRSQETLCD